jgi:hypothetical protein
MKILFIFIYKELAEVPDVGRENLIAHIWQIRKQLIRRYSKLGKRLIPYTRSFP